MPKNLKEAREKLAAKQTELAAVFTEAKTDDGEIDFTKVTCLGNDVKGSIAVAEKVKAMNDELDAIGVECETFQAAEKAAQDHEEREKAVKRPPHPGAANEGNGRDAEVKSFGQQVIEHERFKAFKSGQPGEIILPDIGLMELKTLFQTTAGWAPESTRTGRLVDAVTRPIQVTDIIPSGNTGMASVVYMEETTRTHAAAETAEAAAYKESTFVLAEKTSPVRKITDSIPVTDEQLEDEPMVSGYLNQRLGFGVRQRLDTQILTGNGTAPNLRGINNVVGIQTQAKGADPVPDAIHKAITKVRVTGRAQPNAVIMHDNDWQGIRLLRTADGVYIWGSPSEMGTPRIWGLPVVASDAQTENTAIVGDFMNWSQLLERRGLLVELGFVNDDFTKGKKTLRASLRAALVFYRPAAFATVTGI